MGLVSSRPQQGLLFETPPSGLVAWASLQHEDWIPRASVPREPYGMCATFYELALEITRDYFFHMLLDEGVIKVHSGSRGKVTGPVTY